MFSVFARRLGAAILILAVMLCAAAPFALPGQARAWFTTGQAADIMLSGFGFNTTGGALSFNHLGNIATDGTRLLVCDRFNNRVLIWNTIPTGNVAPDLVLGQAGFETNNPGEDMDRLNWPGGVAVAGGKVVVADSYNDRLLIWNTFPTTNGQAADLVLQGGMGQAPVEGLIWPWGIWTDGTRLAVASTFGQRVQIWNTFPTVSNTAPDQTLYAADPLSGLNDMGTPRYIGTDGSSYLVVGDHNISNQAFASSAFMWTSWPTADNQPYDFFFSQAGDGWAVPWGGKLLASGRYAMLDQFSLKIWTVRPTQDVNADLIVGRNAPSFDKDFTCTEEGYPLKTGDGSDFVSLADGRMFVSLYNGNKILGYLSEPDATTRCPDFAIGAPDIDTNTLVTNGFITNPAPLVLQDKLIVTSDFDRKLYLWNTVPTASATQADVVQQLEFGPWDNCSVGNAFIAGGNTSVAIWIDVPDGITQPTVTLGPTIGSVTFSRITGVAHDGARLYIADGDTGQIHAFLGLPNASSEPLFTLSAPGVERLHSDGNYLAVADGQNHQVLIYAVGGISAASTPVATITSAGGMGFNQPRHAVIVDNSLYIADSSNNRVLAWQSMASVLAGAEPDAILGRPDLTSQKPAIGQDSLFWPTTLTATSNRLWVGEYKFSNRIAGFQWPVEPAIDP